MHHTSDGGVRAHAASQRFLLESIQRGDPFVYALITRENAVKIGRSTNLMNRKSGIDFGGVERFVGYMPGNFEAERRIHRSLDDADVRIYGTREYYWPLPGVLPPINEMREWMGIRPLRRRELPRPSTCTFNRRVMERLATDLAR